MTLKKWSRRLLTATIFALPGQLASAEMVQVSDELTIHYEEAGTGDTVILFVPGWTMTTASFEKQLAAFEGSTEYRFITYDPRSHGTSTHTEGGHFYSQHGRDLDSLIKALDLDNIVLGGWSYGTLSILSYVEQFGHDRLSGLVMIDGAPRGRGKDASKEWIFYTYEDLDGFEQFFTLTTIEDRNALNQGFAEWMLADASEENLQFVYNQTNKTSDTVAAVLNAAGAFENFDDVLVGLEGKIPLLYLSRTEWGPVIEGWAREHTPSATLAPIMQTHMSFWEFPEPFNAALFNFLATIDKTDE